MAGPAAEVEALEVEARVNVTVRCDLRKKLSTKYKKRQSKGPRRRLSIKCQRELRLPKKKGLSWQRRIPSKS